MNTNSSLPNNAQPVNSQPTDDGDPRKLYSLIAPRLLTEEEIEQELAEYVGDQLDREDWSRGQW